MLELDEKARRQAALEILRRYPAAQLTRILPDFTPAVAADILEAQALDRDRVARNLHPLGAYTPEPQPVHRAARDRENWQ